MNTIHIDKNLLKLSNLEVSNQDVKDHKIGHKKTWPLSIAFD